MKNLILLSINLINTNIIYNEYIRLYNNNHITNPMIFTDHCGVLVHKDIPVFNLSYMKQLNQLNQNHNILCSDYDYDILEGLCKFGTYYIINTLNKKDKNYYTVALQDFLKVFEDSK